MHPRLPAQRPNMHNGSWAAYAGLVGLALATACGTTTQSGGTAGSGNGSSGSGSGSNSGTTGSSSSGDSSTGSGSGSGGVAGSGSGSGSSSGGGSGSGGGSSGGASGSSGGSSSGASGSSSGASGSTSGSSGSGVDGGIDAGSDAAAGDAGSTDPNRRKLLLHDEGLFQLTYVDLANPAGRWSVVVPDGNDMQLVGGGRVMLGTGNGYEEHDIATGAKVAENTSFAGTQSAHRLRTGNTLLAGVNWQGGQGIVIVEVNAAGTVQRKIVYPGFTYVRLVRETPQGTFLVTSNRTVFEGQADGTVIWQTLLNPALAKMNAWKALRLASGDTVVSTGYAANLQILGADHKVRQTIIGTTAVAPYFFGNFQVLANGHFVVANWEGHGARSGNTGNQVLEFDPLGTLVWSWKQDPAYISSIQDVIVLDGLDLSRLHVEDTTGMLVPVP